MRFDKETVKAVTRLVELHLRFHGYGGGEWTDSAVRRYVTDAGPLLPRLHRLTRSDCTTRNVAEGAQPFTHLRRARESYRPAARAGTARCSPSRAQWQRDCGHPRDPPGSVLGRAYKHLLTVRLDQGPIGHDVAAQALRAWWAEQPESKTAT